MADTYPLPENEVWPMPDDPRAVVAALQQQHVDSKERIDALQSNIATLLQVSSHTRAEVSVLLGEFREMNGKLLRAVERLTALETRHTDDSGSYVRMKDSVESLQKRLDEHDAVERGRGQVMDRIRPWAEKSAFLLLAAAGGVVGYFLKAGFEALKK